MIPADRSDTNRRNLHRFRFARKQPIAPVTDDLIPESSAFFDVQFRDISTDGFSFYFRKEFSSEKLIAKLGTPPDTVFLLAKVIYQQEVWHDGAWVFRVGCQILRRLDAVEEEGYEKPTPA